MEHPQGPEPLIDRLQVVNVGHQLVHHIHHKSGMILEKVMEILLIVWVQLRWTDIKWNVWKNVPCCASQVFP